MTSSLHALGRSYGTKATPEEVRKFLRAYDDSNYRPPKLLHWPVSYHAMPRRPEVPGWIGEHPDSRLQHLNHIHFDIPRRYRQARFLDWGVAVGILVFRHCLRNRL